MGVSEKVDATLTTIGDGALWFADTFGASYHVVNDSKSAVWIKSGAEEYMAYVVTCAAVVLGVAAVTICSAGTMTAAACAAGSYAICASLGAVNCIEHVRNMLKDQHYTKVEPGESFKFAATCSLRQTCYVTLDPPTPMSMAVA